MAISVARKAARRKEHTDRMIEIDEALVSKLIAEQFPAWSGLPVRAVPRQGWDNRTYRLGEELLVRLPSAEGYAAAVEKEQRALRFLGGALRVPVPAPVALGAPGAGYPFPWSVLRWLPGETLEAASLVDRERLARDLGGWLSDLRALPTEAGYAAGGHSAFRGCHPSAYGAEVDLALRALDGRVDVELCREVWLTATTSVWTAEPVWFHGDLAWGNLLIEHGRLSAVIDFGTCGVGDPACDLVIAWTYFGGAEREIFREAAGLGTDAWQRARGWALWKALITVSGSSGPDRDGLQAKVLDRVLADPIA